MSDQTVVPVSFPIREARHLEAILWSRAFPPRKGPDVLVERAKRRLRDALVAVDVEAAARRQENRAARRRGRR